MRVTQSAVNRNYMKNLNRNVKNLADSNSKLSSLRKFSRVSENTADAAQAFHVREQLYKNEQFLTNIRDAEGELSSAESNLMSMNSVFKTVEERIIQGMNGTVSENGKEIIGREIANLKNQIIQTANAKYGSKFLFGGSNNTDAPFTLDAGGDVLFNGVKVNDIVIDPATNKPSVSNGATPPVYTPVAENADVFIDIGLGLTMNGTDLDTKTAIKVSVSGLDVLGFGKTADGMPNNMIQLLDKISKDFTSGNMDEMSKNLSHLQERSKDFILNLTDIGNRANFLTQTSERIENDIYNLKSTQKTLEGVDIEQEVINNKTYEMAWMVTLQLGTKLIPPSLFDFMR